MENEISILIVEDEALIAENIKMQLEDFGYTIAKICYNYTSAVEAVRLAAFDLLITDIDLGNGIENKSGIQVAQHLLTTQNKPIVFLTAFSDKDTIKKAAFVKPSAYLVKPVNAASLFATVQIAVENFNNNIIPQTHEQNAPTYFFVKQGSKMYKIMWDDVYHLEAVKNYVKINAKPYSVHILMRGSLQNFLSQIVPVAFRQKFVRINRSEAIDKNIITSIEKDAITTPYGEFKTSVEFNKALL
jgi:DNA-binding LytR/AlgR family response regulator